MIKGWDVGVLGMKVGGKRKLTVPAAMAYGKEGSPPDIPPHSTLVFEVDIRQYLAAKTKEVDAEPQRSKAKAKEDLYADAAANARAIADLIDQLGQSIVDKFRPAEDRLANSDGDIQELNKTGCRSQGWQIEKFRKVSTAVQISFPT